MNDSQKSSRTLASSLTMQIRTAIMNGELAPGAKLKITELVALYDVSLSPLREALSRLVAEGLLIAVDQRGYHVSSLSRENLEEIILMRQTLEGLALHRSIETNAPAWRERVQVSHDVLAGQERARPFEIEAWEAGHRDFHMALISGAGMPLLWETCRRLLDRSDRYRRLFIRSRTKDRSVAAEHAAIAAMALQGQAEHAVALLQDHIARTGRNIAAFLDAGGSPRSRQEQGRG